MQNLPAIKDQLNSKDLFEAFKIQLAKDFAQSNFNADFVNQLEPDFNAILDSITKELQGSENKADSTLMQLLYRIDISEAQLRKHLSEKADQNYFTAIAELIIKRVLQKVVIKHYYKGKN